MFRIQNQEDKFVSNFITTIFKDFIFQMYSKYFTQQSDRNFLECVAVQIIYYACQVLAVIQIQENAHRTSNLLFIRRRQV